MIAPRNPEKSAADRPHDRPETVVRFPLYDEVEALYNRTITTPPTSETAEPAVEVSIPHMGTDRLVITRHETLPESIDEGRSASRALRRWLRFLRQPTPSVPEPEVSYVVTRHVRGGEVLATTLRRGKQEDRRITYVQTHRHGGSRPITESTREPFDFEEFEASTLRTPVISPLATVRGIDLNTLESDATIQGQSDDGYEGGQDIARNKIMVIQISRLYKDLSPLLEYLLDARPEDLPQAYLNRSTPDALANTLTLGPIHIEPEADGTKRLTFVFTIGEYVATLSSVFDDSFENPDIVHNLRVCDRTSGKPISLTLSLVNHIRRHLSILPKSVEAFEEDAERRLQEERKKSKRTAPIPLGYTGENEPAVWDAASRAARLAHLEKQRRNNT